MHNRVVINNIPKKGGLVVKTTKGVLNEELTFTFSKFKSNCINIKNTFNNYFKSDKDYHEKMTAFVNQGLSQLSNIKGSDFFNSKVGNLHIHSLSDKKEILNKIFTAYEFPEKTIADFNEGESIYQLEIPSEHSETRVVFERIGSNLISFLFFDTNHHIYANNKLIKAHNSMFFTACPVFKEGCCQIKNSKMPCYMDEYFDEEKYCRSFDYAYSPNKSNR